MKNNNQKKYLAKAAIFVPYGICEVNNDAALGSAISAVYDYMEDFREINMVAKCAYAETKNGSIARITDHIDYIDRWQFEADLKKKKVDFLVIPQCPEYGDTYRFTENIKNVLAAGIDIYDMDEHYYFNTEMDEDQKILDYFEARYEIHCPCAVVKKEVTEVDLENTKIRFPLRSCLLLNHAMVEGSLEAYVQKLYNKIQIMSIDRVNTILIDIFYENRKGEIVKLEVHPFRRSIYTAHSGDYSTDIVNGRYILIIVPSIEHFQSYRISKDNITILFNGSIIYGLEEQRGICKETVYNQLFKHE